MKQKVFIPETLYGIIGHPLGHSLSPLVHNWAFAREGIPGAYMAWPVEPGDLPRFMDAVRALPVSGLSVTIPHKRSVIELVDDLTETAVTIGAVNTVFWREGKLMGENTDVTGFAAALRIRGITPGSALILGAGGAARAAVVGLKFLGAQKITVANRSLKRAEALASEFGIEAVKWDRRAEIAADLVVNTTPLGMSGRLVGESPFPSDAFGPEQVVYDLVYNPVTTRLLKHAKAAGCRIIPGLDMFVSQAVEQFRLWTGHEFSIEGCKALLTERLG